MLDRLSELSKRRLTNGADPSTGSLDAGPLEALLVDREEIRYVLASSTGVRHSTDEKSARIAPGGDNNAYLVVTNQRVFVVMGDDPDDPELTLQLADVTGTELRDGLLKTSVVIRTADQQVAFVPGDLDAARAVVSYVDRIGGAWSDLHTALRKVRVAMEDVEAAIESGEDPTSHVQRARTRISSAYHCATHHDDAPTDLMKAQIEPVESELDRLRVDPRLDRLEELHEVAGDAREDEAFDRAFEAVAEGLRLVDEVRETLDRVDELEAGVVENRLEEVAADLEDGAATMFDGAEQACHRALDATDPDDEVAAWDAALERYRGALTADWDGQLGVSRDALQFQLAWIVGNLVDALTDRAKASEEAGDELGEESEDAVDHYERAHADLERARDLAREHPHLRPERFEAGLQVVADKRDRAEWEWGTLDG